MSGLVVVALLVAGLALIGLGIVALRDDAPKWALRIPRPGRVLSLGIVAVIAAFLVNYYRYSIEEAVGDYVGHRVECEKIGALDVEGDRRDAYACSEQGSEERIGCYAREGDSVIDVTARAERPGAFPGKTIDC